MVAACPVEEGNRFAFPVGFIVDIDTVKRDQRHDELLRPGSGL
jgi:hypothetical protein